MFEMFIGEGVAHTLQRNRLLIQLSMVTKQSYTNSSLLLICIAGSVSETFSPLQWTHEHHFHKLAVALVDHRK